MGWRGFEQKRHHHILPVIPNPSPRPVKETRDSSCLQNTVMVAFPGCYVQWCVPMEIDSVKVTLGVQQDFGNLCTSCEGGPVQANVLFLFRKKGQS